MVFSFEIHGTIIALLQNKYTFTLIRTTKHLLFNMLNHICLLINPNYLRHSNCLMFGLKLHFLNENFSDHATLIRPHDLLIDT